MTEKAILVVDTDTETVEKIKSVLESEGFLVFSASGISESISAAKKINPSLIFVNIAMKDTSGLEISKSIHEIEALQAVPIIVMTPHGGTIEPRYTTTYGIVDFFKKPFSPEELISKTIDTLEMNQAAESPAEEEPPFQSAGEESAPHSFEEELSGEEQKIRETPMEEPLFAATPEELSDPDENEQTLNEPEPASFSEQGMPDESFAEQLRTEDIAKREEAEAEQKEKIAEEEEPVLSPDPPLKEDNIRNLLEKQEGAGWRRDLLVPIIGVFLVAIGAGFFLYKGLVHDTKTGEPVSPKTPTTVIDQPQQNGAVSPQRNTPPSAGPDNTQSSQSQAAAVKKAPLPSAKTTRSAPALPKKAPIQAKAPGHTGRPKTSHSQKPATEVNAFYAVQIGVFKSKANAAALVKRSRKLGPHVFTLQSKGKNKQAFYRVLVGRFGSVKEAAALAKKIRSKENIQAVIFQKK